MEEYRFVDRILAIFLLLFSAVTISVFVLIATPPIALFVVSTDMIYLFLLMKLNIPHPIRGKGVTESIVKFYCISWFTWKAIVSLIFHMWNGKIDVPISKESRGHSKKTDVIPSVARLHVSSGRKVPTKTE